MFKRGEKLHNLFTVLITWAVLLALFFAYEAYFVDGQKGFLRERGFRVLASLSNELRARVDQAQISVASSIKLVAKEGAPANEKTVKAVKTKQTADDPLPQYLKFYLQDALTHDEAVAPSQDCRVNPGGSPPLETTFEGNGLIFRVFCFSSKGPEAANRPDLKSEIQIHKLDLGEPVRQSFAALGGYFDDVLVADSTGHVVFQQSSTGRVVRDLKAFAPNKDSANAKQDSAGSDSASKKATAALSGVGKDSAQGSSKTSENENETRWIQELGQANTFSTVTLGEEAYYLFSQPVRIPTGNYSAIGGEEFDFVVCGLRRAGSFEAAVHTVPYTILIWLSLLAAALFSLSWPFFKLRYMSDTERFSPRDGWYLIFAIFLASTSTMMMFLNSTYGSEMEIVSDNNARQLAAKIKENVRNELNTAALQLRLLTTNPATQKLFNDPSRPKFIANYLTGRNTSGVQPDKCYPYFEIAFWANRDGDQLMKFDVHPVTTPATNVSSQEFFTTSISDLNQMRALEQEKDGAKIAPLAAQAGECAESPAPAIGSADHVHLKPEFSPNTDEFYMVLASPVLSEETAHPGAEIAVQALATKPLSLIAPLMPPGYSFAVIDQQCDVLFDSDLFRNLKENFCEESKTKDELTPWLFSGVDKSIEITYSARPGRAFLTSLTLPGLAEGQAYLIVFRDPDLKPSLNLAIIVVCSILMGTWFFFLLAAAALHLALRKPFHWIYAPEFIWPSPSNAASYAQVFVANGVLSLLFWSFYQRLYEGPLLGLTLAVAIFTVVFSVLKLCHKAVTLLRAGRILTFVSAAMFVVFLVRLAKALWLHESKEPLEEWMTLFGLLGVFGQIAALLSRETMPLWASRAVASKRIESLKECATKYFSVTYALAALSVINAVGLVPCAGFFKYSYDAVSELSLKRDQIKLSEEILERKDRVRQYYEKLGALKFADERLSNIWDRYDSIFFKTDCEHIATAIAQDPRSPVPEHCDQSNGQEGTSFSHSAEIINEWIEKTIAQATLFFPSNQIGLEMSRLGVASTGTNGDRPWEHSWDELSPRRFTLRWNDDSRLPKLTVTSDYPRWAGLRPGPFTGMTLLLVVLIFWLTSLAKKIFFTDVEDTPGFETVAWKSVNDIQKSYLVIGLAKSSKTDKLRAIADLPPGDWRDLRVELNRMKSPYYEKPSCQGNVLILDHFEANLNDHGCNLRRLRLLESLLYETEIRIVAVSNVDPLYFLAEGDPEILTDSKDPEDARRLLDRWARVLSKLTKVRVKDNETKELEGRIAQSTQENVNPQLVSWIWQECWCTSFLGKIGIEILDQFRDKQDVTEAWLVTTVLDRADSYYHVLWSGMTTSERMVLYQLALDGWANPKNTEAIQQLERKHIIYRDPMYRIMNESFRTFIQSAEHADEIAEWEKFNRQSTWRALRLVMIAAAVGGAVWLFHAQTELFQTGIGYVAAIATLLTAVTGLVGRSKVAAPTESGATQ